MYGLIMLREYLDEILEGKKSYDARAHDTSKRGTIALVDSRKSSIIELVDLVSTHKYQLKSIANGMLLANGKA